MSELSGSPDALTFCMHCNATFQGPIDLDEHWDQGRCRNRPPAEEGGGVGYELVEDRNGVLRPRRMR